MPYLIDPPVGDTLEAWREFLAELEDELTINPGDEDLIRAINEALEHITEASGR
jgi:hypothetical protein